jgi:poly-gamma-glutamate synthesis protein (capsule biosynthesis protein)
VVIAYFHWCNTKEWTSRNYPQDRAVARAAINAGADLVLGAHRHLPAGIECYRNRYIVYDLSNFVVGLKHKNDNASLIFQWKVSVDKKGAVCDEGISVIPCTTTTSGETYPATDGFGDEGARVNNWQPAILAGAEGQALIDRIQALSNVHVPMGAVD